LKLPKDIHLLSIKKSLPLVHPGVLPGQAKTLADSLKEEAGFAVRLHLSRKLSPSFERTPAFIGEVDYR
jgi:hypothetical protein